MIDNKKFAERCRKVAENGKTLYALGGWGQKLTSDRKKYFIDNYDFNRSIANKKLDDGSIVPSDRKNAINIAGADVQAYDCNCFVKAMIDSDESGRINYAVPCPDVTIVQMLKDCTEVSSDFSKLMPGELLTFEDKTHCAVYIGNGKTVESLWHWADGVQIRPLDNRWKYHGKMTKYITYNYADESEKVDTADIQKKLEMAQNEINEALELLKNL